MMKRPQRSILPASSDSQYAQSVLGQEHGEVPRINRRSRNVLVACNHCRSKRKACNGQRPACARCIEGNLACVYESSNQNQTRSMALKMQMEDLKRNLKEHVDFFEQLSSMPEKEAIAVLHQMKTTPKPSVSLATLMGNVSTVNRPSDLKHAHGTLPSTNSALESELMIFHSIIYPLIDPIHPTSINVDTLLRDAPHKLPNSWDITSTSAEPEMVPPAILLPRRKVRFVDDRLEFLNLEYWTRAPIANETAARAISLYLEIDHPVLGFFDAELFLTDLINQQLDYCSPFLVSALLYLSCQSYASVDVAIHPVIRILFNEAKVLWTSERSSGFSATSVSATIIFGLACTLSGNEKLAFRLLTEVRQKARQIGLFGVSHDSAASKASRGSSQSELQANAHVAWGAYNWLSLHSIFFHEEPIASPPALPIPGEVEGSEMDHSTLHWPSHPLPSYMGQTFPFLSKLWVIVQEIQAVYLRDGKAAPPDSIPLAFAESNYQKLLSWASSLPRELQQNDQSPSHVLILHGLFHGIVIDLFRPFTDYPAFGQRLNSFYSQDSTPYRISDASFNQIKRIVYIYMSQYQPQLHCMVFSSVVLELNSVLLRTDHDPEKRLYLLLGMFYLTKITARYPVYAEIARAHLTMAMRGGLLNSTEALWLLDQVRQSGQHSTTAIDEATTSCIVDLDLAITARVDAQADVISRQFEEELVFDEFTTGSVGRLPISKELEKGKEAVVDKSEYSGVNIPITDADYANRFDGDSQS